MKNQLVVDAACDLPPSFFKERNILILPIHVQIDDKSVLDERNPSMVAEIYQNKAINMQHEVDSRPSNAEEIEDILMTQVVPTSKFAVVQTTSKKRSETFNNCEKAQKLIQANVRSQIDSGQRDTAFGMRVMNAANMFTGQGLLAAFTSDLLAADKPMKDVLRLAEAFKSRIVAYAVPADVAYVRERARKRGEDSVSLVASLVAKSLDIKPIIQFKDDNTEVVSKTRGFGNATDVLFNYAAKRIEHGLLSPYVVVAIAGNPDDLTKYESYKHLQDVAIKAKVKLLTCMMGLAAGINLGQGSVSISLASEDHSFTE
jgi:DegV family protein with EDD domain